MDNILTELITVPNLIFCIIIAILVEVQNRLIGKLWKNSKTNKIYQEFFLPLGPLGTGAILAGLVSGYPYPEMFASNFWARVFWGIICGLSSAHVYRIAKKFLVKKDETDVPNVAQ